MCHSWFKWYACKKLQIYFRYSIYFCTCDWFIKLQHVQNYKTFFSNISKLLYLMLWPCDIFSTVCLDCFQCFQIHASHIDLKITQRFILMQIQILCYLVYPRLMISELFTFSYFTPKWRHLKRTHNRYQILFFSKIKLPRVMSIKLLGNKTTRRELT